MKQEIERKYEIKELPKDLKIETITKIEQTFIYDDGFTLIRLRKQTSTCGKETKVNYVYTTKTNGNIKSDNNYQISQKYEIEKYITKEQYDKLKKNKINNEIQKTRIVVPIDNCLKAEIDIYDGYLQDFLTVEVEFENKTKAKEFEKPYWFGEEIGYKELSNRKLSKMTEEDWKNKVTKEFIENNKRIIEKLINIIS